MILFGVLASLAHGQSSPESLDLDRFFQRYFAARHSNLREALRLAESFGVEAQLKGDPVAAAVAGASRASALLYIEGPNAALRLLEATGGPPTGAATLDAVVLESAYLECMLQVGRIGSAVGLLPELSERVSRVAPPAFACAFALMEATAHSHAETYGDPMEPIRRLRLAAQLHGCQGSNAWADHLEHWVHYTAKRNVLAAEFRASARRGAEALGDLDLQAHSYFDEGLELWLHGDYDEALTAVRLGLDGARRQSNLAGCGHLWSLEVDVLRDLGRPDDAWRAFQRLDGEISGRGFLRLESEYLTGALAVAADRGDDESLSALYLRKRQIDEAQRGRVAWLELAESRAKVIKAEAQRETDLRVAAQRAAKSERAVLAGVVVALCVVSALLALVFVSRVQLRRVNAKLHREIVATRAAEEARAESERRVHNLEHLKGLGVMAGGIAHDFNNLLTGVLGNAELLLSADNLGPDDTACAEEIASAGERAAQLCRRLLIYAGKVPPRAHEVDLNQLVPGLLRPLRSSVSDTEIEFTLAERPAWVDADPTQIDQVLMNLCLNAKEAGGRRIELRVGHVELAHDDPAAPAGLPAGDYVVIECRDDGKGMTPEVRKRLFEPFYTTRFDGRGLGLAEVFGIAKEHGGGAFADGQPGVGAVLSVYLPALAGPAEGHGLTPARTPARTEDPPLAAATDDADSVGTRLDGNVVIVDDEAPPRNLAATILKRAGMNVTSFSDGRSALRHLELHGQETQLVVLDVTMPQMDGGEVLRAARVLFPALPVLLMSGHCNAEALAAVEGESPPLLSKPFGARDLRAAVEPLLVVPAQDSARDAE